MQLGIHLQLFPEVTFLEVDLLDFSVNYIIIVPQIVYSMLVS